MSATAQSPLGPERSGVYRTPPGLELLQQAAARLGVAYFTVDLGGARTKADFLDRCARTLGFPRTFGGNWDAFADSVQDLSWHPARGYVIHLQQAADFARAAPDDYATAVEILRSTAEFWKERATSFIALVDDAAELLLFTA